MPLPKKCAALGCLNYKGNGRFVGKFCEPCDNYFTKGFIGGKDFRSGLEPGDASQRRKLAALLHAAQAIATLASCY